MIKFIITLFSGSNVPVIDSVKTVSYIYLLMLLMLFVISILFREFNINYLIVLYFYNFIWLLGNYILLCSGYFTAINYIIVLLINLSYIILFGYGCKRSKYIDYLKHKV